MNILILGNGGREYSIGLAIYKENAHSLFFMPGNGATSNLGKNINITDYEKLAIFAKENSIDYPHLTRVLKGEVNLTERMAEKIKLGLLELSQKILVATF